MQHRRTIAERQLASSNPPAIGRSWRRLQSPLILLIMSGHVGLESIRLMLQADGYDITERASVDTRRVFEVTAGENACFDCLVPKTLMQELISQHLEIDRERIKVNYPPGSYHEQ